LNRPEIGVRVGFVIMGILIQGRLSS
jgi:hypothetical protein